MHILLAEDDLVNQKIAFQILTKWGIEVTVAKDGTEAVAMMHDKKFNLVLMDINMPVMDGCEATQNIRALHDPYFKTVPILAYTASSLADTKEKAEKLGMNDFVSKPLSPEEMHCKINQHVLSSSTEFRPLKINLHLYADSDIDFKIELVELMVSNLRELQYASYKAYYDGDPRYYATISHKVKSVLILLNDQEFMDVIDDLKSAFGNEEKLAVLQEKINKFNYLSECIIKTLERELSSLRS
jgi:CheY-like chemotaxis protein